MQTTTQSQNAAGRSRATLFLQSLVTTIACMTAGSPSFAQALPGARPLTPITPEQQLELLKTFHGEFVPIAPGTDKFPKSFVMGSAAKSESPAHEVAIAAPFAMAKYEVPQNLYQAVSGTNPSVWGGPRNSVEMVTWRDAVAFCRKATTLMRQAKLLSDDEEIRLPTEAEWEYCCRAGTKTAYSFGDESRKPTDAPLKATVLNEFGWHTGNAAGNDPPVGALKPNGWGLYDMHGYLWEYVADEWHPDYAGAPADGTTWEGNEPNFAQRVIRSGSWRDRYDALQSTTRRAIPDHVRSDAIGFRCVKAAVQKP